MAWAHRSYRSTAWRLLVGGVLALTAVAGAPSLAAQAAVDAQFTGGVTLADGSSAGFGTVVAVGVGDTAGSVFGSVIDGRFSLSVPPGAYQVSFQTGREVQQTSWAASVRSQADATTYMVAAGDVVALDQVVPQPATISGRLLEAGSGTPVPGACVDVVDPADRQGALLARGCADATGAYATSGDLPTGTWLLRTYDATGLHLETTRTLAVTQGVPVGGIDLSLPVAGTITGRVVDVHTGAPVTDACIQAFAGRTTTAVGGGGPDAGGCTDATGRWFLRGMPTGPVTVLVNGGNSHISRWATDATTQATATIFRAVAGATVRTGTVQLHPGATLTGRVTDRAGRPVAGATVAVADPLQPPLGPAQVSTTTGADGRYTLVNIPPQRQSVRVEAPYGSGLAWQWSGGATSPDTAKVFSFALDKRYSQNFTLAPEATLTVTPSAGWTSDVWLYVQSPSGAYLSAQAEALAGSGSLVVRGLPAGTVVVQRFPISITDTASWYDGSSTLAGATRVTLTAGRNTAITLRTS